MTGVNLTDGAVAVLAQQAAELIGPDAVVRVRPSAADDPYRWGGPGRGWEVHIDPHVQAWIDADAAPAEALAEMIDHLDEVSESEEHWGRALPECPGHKHMASVGIDGIDVVLRCPSTGEIVRRITPAVPQ
jgi:hypothetical protein